MNGKKPDPAETADKSEREHVEEVLDESLDESFPASDPPAITEPRRTPRPHDAD